MLLNPISLFSLMLASVVVGDWIEAEGILRQCLLVSPPTIKDVENLCDKALLTNQTPSPPALPTNETHAHMSPPTNRNVATIRAEGTKKKTQNHGALSFACQHLPLSLYSTSCGAAPHLTATTSFSASSFPSSKLHTLLVFLITMHAGGTALCHLQIVRLRYCSISYFS